MAKKKQETEGSSEGALVQAAKTIGEAAGKIAAAVGVAKPEPGAPKVGKPKPQKLAKKNKSRFPRKQKKAAAKTKST